MTGYSNVQFKLYFLCGIFPDHWLHTGYFFFSTPKRYWKWCTSPGDHSFNSLYCFFFLFLILYHSSRCCWCPVQNPINGQGTCCPSCCECWLLISHSYPPFYRIGLSNLAKSLCPLLPTQGQPTARYSLTEYKRLIPARPTSFLSSLPWPTLPLSLPFTWAPSPNKSCVPTFFLRLYFYGTWPMIIIQHITFIYL